MNVTLIAAMDSKGGIGKDNKLPWDCPADLAYFKKMTMGKPILMGRRTFESIGERMLPGRMTVVVSRDGYTLDMALRDLSGCPEIMVIGGGQIYEQLLPLASKIVATILEGSYDCDTFFPEIYYDDWHPYRVDSFDGGMFTEYHRVGVAQGPVMTTFKTSSDLVH